MLSKVIDKFLIEEKAAKDKDYYSKIHEINTKYELKIGDTLCYINYENRGVGYYNTRILDIKEDGLIIKEGRSKIYFLKWKDEDGNRLVFYPFYTFKNGINDKNFFKKVTKSISDFYQTEYKDYRLNFKNIKRAEFEEDVKQTCFLNIV
ncbi:MULTISPECIES: hypothetical protein [Clostridium]|uniref:hypothetical protein n=1 Tax=Clostridium TaxID=1485 RepID=UPI0005FAC1A2|nr:MULTISPECIES: hypothetical protein [Clostridium]DAL62021.1 MAG TPA_asm: hypothetical protein [Caudoviricetes sp.]KJZ83898.1 hypothetical protein ClosIBUN125C_CONTIG68g03789 [Clostridium sp. IBUN125C]KJZ87943.1 hypothetical protein ClosIBUN13A_CONTIG46g00498 [Clostridium sp. IBUN13A]KJZ93379.1 hypothetical protein ClosIBUN62F_CONTIG43g01513 [Clostridium sp. IBUN62F]KJZ96420.1 hypothetical protein ClosIBUN22A_CONTIG113g02341 [Clostridium sp. IBUN22A]